MHADDVTLLQNVALIVGTVVLVAVGLRVINVMRRQVKGGAEAPDDLLSPLEQAYQAGQMDSAEFRRIRESVERQRAEPDPASPPRRVPPPATPPPGPTGPPGPEPPG